MSEKRQVMKAAGLVGAFTLISRMTGLVRDAVLAAMFGATRLQDIFLLCFELPNMVRRVLGEGALSAFLVPLFSERRERDGEAAGWEFFNRVVNLMLLIALAIAAVGMLFSREAFLLFGGLGLRMGRQHITTEDLVQYVGIGSTMTRIMFPFVIGLTLTSVFMAACHTLRRFGPPSIGSVMLNLSMIAVGVVALRHGVTDERAAVALCWAVLVGAALRVLLMVPTLWRHGWRWRPTLTLRDRELLRLMRMLGIAIATMSISQVNIIVSTFFAFYLSVGVKTSLVFSQRLVQLPMALTATAVATGMLPQLTSYLLEGRKRDLHDMMAFTKRVEIVFMNPAMWGLIFLGVPILELLYQRRAWTAADTQATYLALLFYAPGLLPLGWVRLLTPLFYARKDLVTPFKAALVSMIANLALNYYFALHTPMQQAGLALANSLAALTNYLALSWYARRLLDPTGGSGPARIFETFWKSTVASLIACGLGWAVHLGWVAQFGAPGRTLSRAALVLPLVAAVGVLYFVLCRMLHVPDSRRATEMLLARLRGRRA